MQEWKKQEWKSREQIAGLENAGELRFCSFAHKDLVFLVLHVGSTRFCIFSRPVVRCS